MSQKVLRVDGIIHLLFTRGYYSRRIKNTDIPFAKETSIQGKEIFDTKTDTESHSHLELGMKRQGLYYASLQVANVKKIAQGAWSWPSEFVPGGLSSLFDRIQDSL